MEIRITNSSYPSLTSRHTKFYPCSCDECQYEQVFKVDFEYKRSQEDIKILTFRIYCKDNLDVTNDLNVRDYDKLMVEMEDWVACVDYWDTEDQEESKNDKNFHYY